MSFRKNEVSLTKKNKNIMVKAKRRMDRSNTVEAELDIWHKRMGHLNERDLKHNVNEGLAHGINLSQIRNYRLLKFVLHRNKQIKVFQFEKNTYQLRLTWHSKMT